MAPPTGEGVKYVKGLNAFLATREASAVAGALTHGVRKITTYFKESSLLEAHLVTEYSILKFLVNHEVSDKLQVWDFNIRI